jgi:hypothetical protein
MSETRPDHSNLKTGIPNFKSQIRFVLWAAIALGAMGACWWAAGGSLGLFIGGLFVATFVVPAAALERRFLLAIEGIASVVVPVALFWLIAVAANSDTIGQWAEASIVLLAYSFALAGIALVLGRLKIPPLFATSIAVTIAVAWLTWPIWLPPNAGPEMNTAIQHLVASNPPLTINGILTAEPAWTEHSVAYHLTNLNQDIAIELPSSIAPCVALHAAIATALWLAALAKTPKTAANTSLAA